MYLDNGRKLVLNVAPPCFAEWAPPADAITKVGEGDGGKDLDSGMSRIARLARQNIQLVTDKREEDRAKEAEKKLVSFAEGTKGDKKGGGASAALTLFETERQKAVRELDEERRRKGAKRKERVLQARYTQIADAATQVRRRKCLGLVLLTIGNWCFV